jgi:hypothetical protein
MFICAEMASMARILKRKAIDFLTYAKKNLRRSENFPNRLGGYHYKRS